MPRDALIEHSLQNNLNELAIHSFTVFEYAHKLASRKDRECVFWSFTSLEDSICSFKAATVSYKSLSQARATQYAPVVGFIEQYDPTSMFVALVAIRTGDKRDALMKCMLLGRDASEVPGLPEPRMPQGLFYQLPSGKLKQLPRRVRFCSNLVCEEVETKSGEFPLCSNCHVRCYCSKVCQVQLFLDLPSSHVCLSYSRLNYAVLCRLWIGRRGCTSFIALAKRPQPTFRAS